MKPAELAELHEAAALAEYELGANPRQGFAEWVRDTLLRAARRQRARAAKKTA
jgi:hypothetical protein